MMIGFVPVPIIPDNAYNFNNKSKQSIFILINILIYTNHINLFHSFLITPIEI